MVCTADRAESQMFDMYILETGNKMQGKTLTKCRFFFFFKYKTSAPPPRQ